MDLPLYPIYVPSSVTLVSTALVPPLSRNALLLSLDAFYRIVPSDVRSFYRIVPSNVPYLYKYPPMSSTCKPPINKVHYRKTKRVVPVNM